MILWLDAHLSPTIATWIGETFDIEVEAVRDVGLRDATDRTIFDAAQGQNATVMTKDRDFIELLQHHGPPPHVIWLTCGNTSNARLREVLSSTLSDALALLAQGEPLVEISGD